MLILHSLAPPLLRPNISFPNSLPPVSTVALPIQRYVRPKTPLFIAMATEDEIGEYENEDEEEIWDRFRRRGEDGSSSRSTFGIGGDADKGGFSSRKGFRDGSRKSDKCDGDPEYDEILGAVLDDPQKAISKVEERFRKKRNSILHTKTGSGKHMKVLFNKFKFSHSHIWFEFHNIPLEKDICLVRDAIRSWYIIGCLGGCNSLNMQLSESDTECKKPSYDAIEGADVTPAAFYNIGDLEVQYNVARVWVDFGSSDPLALDILVNALTQISSDYVGIKKVVFGGSEYENWNENLKTEETGYSVHKI